MLKYFKIEWDGNKQLINKDLMETLLKDKLKENNIEEIGLNIQVIKQRTHCIKCGSNKIKKEYHTGGDYGKGKCKGNINKKDEEHLHFYCKVCNYDWIVEPLKKEGDKK